MSARHAASPIDFLTLAGMQSMFRREVAMAPPGLRAIGQLLTLSTETILRRHVAGEDYADDIIELGRDVVIPLVSLGVLSFRQVQLEPDAVFTDLLELHRVLLAQMLR